MILELINPSDAVTFVGDDMTVAGVACLILGGGWYGLKDASGDAVVPMMAFGTHEKWLEENNIADLSDWLMEHGAEVAGFLETCVYGSIEEREAFDQAISRMAPDKADEHRDWWNDRNRSSMNNIGKAAAHWAKRLRAKAEATATN